MKKFDLEAAKKGEPVVTRSGKTALVVYTERSSQFSVVALINNVTVQCYTPEGKFYKDKDSDQDLMMK